MPSGLSTPFSASVRLTFESLDAVESRIQSGRRLPHAARSVGARHDSGDDAAGHEGVVLPSLSGSDSSHAREIERGVARRLARQPQIGKPFLGVGCRCVLVLAPGGGRIHDEHGAPFLAIRHGRLIDGGKRIAVSIVRRNAKQVEEVRFVQCVEPGLVVLAALKRRLIELATIRAFHVVFGGLQRGFGGSNGGWHLRFGRQCLG